MEYGSLRDLEDQLDFHVRDVIDAVERDNWDDENPITRNLLVRLRRALDGTIVHWPGSRDQPAHIVSRMFKAKGAVETVSGDLAIRLTLTWPDTTVNGVAFLEAKRREWRKNTLPSFKPAQAKRISARLKHAQLLIYDRHGGRPGLQNGPGGVAKKYHAHTVPLDIVLAAKTSKPDSLYRWSTSLGHRIAQRYLRGLDLEYESSVLALADGLANREDMQVPTYVLATSVSAGGVNPEPVSLSQELYEPIRTDE